MRKTMDKRRKERIEILLQWLTQRPKRLVLGTDTPKGDDFVSAGLADLVTSEKTKNDGKK